MSLHFYMYTYKYICISPRTMSMYTQPANVSICLSWFVNFPTYQTNVIKLFTHLSDTFNHCPEYTLLSPEVLDLIAHAWSFMPSEYSPLRNPQSSLLSTQASSLLALSQSLSIRNRWGWWGWGCTLRERQSECRRWGGEWSGVRVGTMRMAFLGQSWINKREAGRRCSLIEPTNELRLIIKPGH